MQDIVGETVTNLQVTFYNGLLRMDRPELFEHQKLHSSAWLGHLMPTRQLLKNDYR